MKTVWALAILAVAAAAGFVVLEALDWRGLAAAESERGAAPTESAHGHAHAHGSSGEAHSAEPQPKDPNRLWCKEHGVYEDECYICHPELAEAPKEGELMCNEHGVPEAECAICQPDLAGSLKPGQGLKLRIPSGDGLEKAGVSTGRAGTGEATEAIRVASRVAYDSTRLARVTSRVAGVVESVAVEVGTAVGKGEALAELSSTHVSESRGEYAEAVAEEALAKATYDREKGLVAKGISPRKDLEAAEAAHRAAQARSRAAREAMKNHGIEPGGSGGTSITVRAPFDGTVIEQAAVTGEAVEEGAALFTVADLSSLWIELAIPESRIAQVKVGDAVKAQFEALPGLTFEAELAWLDSKVDGQSRTVAGRATVTNPNGLLRDGMYGRVELAAGSTADGLRLPTAAVQEFEGKPFVFVKLEDDLYEVREVALGRRDGDRVQVVEGLRGEEEIVLARSYTLKSEFLKSRLGAGCTDH